MVHMAQCQYTPAYSTHRRIALSFPIKGFRCYCSMFTKLFGFEVSYFFFFVHCRIYLFLSIFHVSASRYDFEGNKMKKRENL